MTTAKKLIEECENKGFVTLGGGVYLQAQEDIMNDQEAWSDDDESKEMDFTTAPYWITTDDGAVPEAVYDEDDLKKYL